MSACGASPPRVEKWGKRRPDPIVVIVFLALACAKKEQPPAPAPPVTETHPVVRVTRPDPAAPPGSTHEAVWSIPSRGVVLWLIGDDAKPEYGGALATWSNPYLPTAKATADRPEMQPSVASEAINQHAVVRFDGIANIMQANIDISPATMPNLTICAAFTSRTDAPTPLRKLYGDDDGGFDRAAGLDNRGGDKNFTIFTGSGAQGDFSLQSNETYVTCDAYTKTDVSTWVNGKETLVRVPGTWGTALPNMYIGGTGPNYHEPWQGDIAEIVVYSRVIADLERMQVEDYLAKKYGVALTR